MQYQRNGRTSEACGLIAREEIEEDGYTLESVECEAKEEMKRVPSLASDRKTKALAWCRGLCLGFSCLRMARVCPPFGTGGGDQPPAAYFKEASYGSCTTCLTVESIEGKGLHNHECGQEDLCKLVIHALRKSIFLTNNLFNETFLALKWMSALGDGGLIGQEVVL